MIVPVACIIQIQRSNELKDQTRASASGEAEHHLLGASASDCAMPLRAAPHLDCGCELLCVDVVDLGAQRGMCAQVALGHPLQLDCLPGRQQLRNPGCTLQLACLQV